MNNINFGLNVFAALPILTGRSYIHIGALLFKNNISQRYYIVPIIISIILLFFTSFVFYKTLCLRKKIIITAPEKPDEQQATLDITLENIGEGLIFTDAKGLISYMNPAAENITGHILHEAAGKPLKDVFRTISEDSGLINEFTLDSIIPEKKPREKASLTTLIDKSGAKHSIFSSLTHIKADSGDFMGLALVFHDIKDMKCVSKAVNEFMPSNPDASTETVKSQPLPHMQGKADAMSGLPECKENRYAYFDSLTNLPNRKLFYDQLSLALIDVCHKEAQTAVIFIDLDLFKNINDTLGHNIGDLLLLQASERLSGILPEGASDARMGGDEFAVLLPRIKERAEAVQTAINILRVFSAPFDINNNELFVSASIGIAFCPEHGEDTHAILKNAASAMYKAKELGRNNYQIYSPEMNENILHKFKMHKDLRRALERNEFVLHYQPKVDGKTGEMIGVEALVRWKHPDRGLVFPLEFIPLAEETGLIKPLGEWVLRTACNQLKTWLNAGHHSLRLAVNLSAWQFKEQDLADTVANVLKETGLDPAYLELEITETAAMENLNFTIDTLGKLMNMGVFISIDDFGTGYSSLNYLKHFPINFLKIDRSFVSDILDDKNTCAIVKAIIEVAHTLNLKVIAEGVETRDQLTLLQAMGCDEIQGYFISKPLPVEEVEKRMSGAAIATA